MSRQRRSIFRDGKRLPDSSPFKYVDSATVPFVVVPRMIIEGVEA
jgi:hypothetical protein